MSSFYGDIKNSNRISLIFDKIYPNRKTMEKECTEDGIFNSRYVLIDYGEIKTFPFTRVFPTIEEFDIGVIQEKYYKVLLVPPPPDNILYGDIGYDPTKTRPYTKEDKDSVFNADGELKTQVYIKRERAIDSITLNTEPEINTNPKNRPAISEFVVNKEIDLAKYGDQFHHTVWQKIWTQTGSENTVVEKYICVAHLDAETPQLNLIVDAPSDLDREGFAYITTDKNVDGYLTKKRFDSLQANGDTAVYIENQIERKAVYTAAQEYDIGKIYYCFKKVNEYNPVNTFEKINGDTLYVQPYQAPILYSINSLKDKEEIRDKANNKVTFYYDAIIKGRLQYIEVTDVTDLPRETYYYFTETAIAADSYVKDGSVFIKFAPPELFELILAPTGNDFQDGYITEEKYIGFEKELFYFDNEGNNFSTFSKLLSVVEAKEAFENNELVYYLNNENKYILKTSDSWPTGYEYFVRDPYDKESQYWEITNIGQGPHFDPLKSTDLEYMFHVPRPWKFAREVDFEYNQKGFYPYEKNYIGYAPNVISLEIQEEATTQYPEHMPDLPDAAEYDKVPIKYGEWKGDSYRSTLRMTEQPDTKYFDIKLPQIGNIMSDVWDTIYPRGFMHLAENIPESEYVDFVNMLITEEGYAKYYYLDKYKPGILTEEKFYELYNDLYILNSEQQYIKATVYDYAQVYYIGNFSEDVIEYSLVDSDIKIYYPIYDINRIIEEYEKDNIYTFEKNSEGAIRVMFMGNDREPNNSADYPGTVGEIVRHAYYLLGLKSDNDTLDNPPRGTIYGLLNGAKTLYGDPADKMTGTYKEAGELQDGKITEDEFYELKDLLWYYDEINSAWAKIKEEDLYDSEEIYFIITDPNYQLVPTDLPGVEDGYISEDLFEYMREAGKWPLYTYNTDGSFSPVGDNDYDATTQYYSNLTTLWAYLNDLKEKFPLYQCDWANNNSNSIGYIKNRPTMVIQPDEYQPGEDGAIIIDIMTLWNEYHALDNTTV